MMKKRQSNWGKVEGVTEDGTRRTEVVKREEKESEVHEKKRGRKTKGSKKEPVG